MVAFVRNLLFHAYFLQEKFGYEKLSPVKYFNQCLLNCTQTFLSDLDYIVFTLSATQQLKL